MKPQNIVWTLFGPHCDRGINKLTSHFLRDWSRIFRKNSSPKPFSVWALQLYCEAGLWFISTTNPKHQMVVGEIASFYYSTQEGLKAELYVFALFQMYFTQHSPFWQYIGVIPTIWKFENLTCTYQTKITMSIVLCYLFWLRNHTLSVRLIQCPVKMAIIPSQSRCHDRSIALTVLHVFFISKTWACTSVSGPRKLTTLKRQIYC